MARPKKKHHTPGKREERNELLAAAGRDGRGVAVWIAIYAGLRRCEIWRLRWSDVSLERRRLTVQPAKTARRRVIQLASGLQEVLEPGAADQDDYVVPRSHDWTW